MSEDSWQLSFFEGFQEIFKVTAGSVDACLRALAHILRSVSQHLGRNCICDVFDGSLQFRDGLRFDAAFFRDFLHLPNSSIRLAT